MSLHRVASLDDIWSGEMRGVRVGEERILLVNVDGDLRAYADRCIHQGIPLSEGRLDGARLVCSAHAWEYDARTGQGLNPCHVHLRSFPIVVRGDEIAVELEDEP